MVSLNPYWGGLDYIQDSTPEDGGGIVFLPSLVSDVTAAVPQLEAIESVQQFLQSGFRASTENLYGAGLMISSGV